MRYRSLARPGSFSRLALLGVGAPLLWSCHSNRSSTTVADAPAEARVDASGDGAGGNDAIPIPIPIPIASKIHGIPHVRQKPDFCGEACVEMVLRTQPELVYAGFDQDDVFALSGVDPQLGRGAYTKELVTAVRRVGFDPGSVWFEIRRDEPSDLDGIWKSLEADLARDVPSIVCMRYADRPKTTEHFRLVVGFDAERDEVIYHEPAEDDAAYRRMSRKLFLKLWPLHYRPDRSTVIRLVLDPADLPEGGSDAVRERRAERRRTQAGFSPADYAQHVQELKERLLGDGFTIVVEPPFVVIGDEPAHRVRERAKNTVRWAARNFQELYFKKFPHRILDVWLFRNEDSYRRNTKKLWDEEPGTPYGYYSAHNGALVMNIATGGGTLVHEIAHPFMESNFDECPSWLNEGLASLYEQCAERRGKMVGLTNWRLRGLQDALRAGEVPSFKTLMSMTTHEFYNEDPGTNYSQARYLCYYLQETGRLEKYYHAFVRAADKDPTGYKTLQSVLDEEDLPAFQKRWEKWVMTLRFPS